MRGYAWALVSCLPVFAGTTQAAEVVGYGPAPGWVKSVAMPPADNGAPDAPVRLLDRSYQLRFTATSLQIYSESYVALQTPQGLQAFGSLQLPWKPDTDVLTVHKLRLLRGDKAIDLLAAGQKFEVLRREDNLEYAALDGILTAVLQPAGMEVGDVLNMAFSIQRESSLIGSPEIALADFALLPTSHVEVRASWDKSVPLRWRATQDVEGVKEQRLGADHELTWVGTNLEPLNQPGNVPARFWRYPMIEFTSYVSWNDVSRMLAPLYAAASSLRADSPLKAEARAIAEAHADSAGRLEAALKLAQDRVRYVFLGMGDGNVNPAPVDLTWERRFGDCKGKTALLMALLRELGIESEPVLVAVTGGDAIAERLPQMSVFDHVIVRAHVDGATWWLDGAGSGAWRRSDMVTPGYQWGLPVTARGDALLRMQAEPAATPQVETSTFIDAHEGIHVDAPFNAETRVHGPGAVLLRTQLSQLSQSRRDQELKSYWKRAYDFVDVKLASLDYDEATGTATLRMEGTARMNWGGDSYTADGLRVGAPADYDREPGINIDAPFPVPHPVYTVTRQRIELPAVGKFSTKGSDYDVTLAGVQFSRHSKIESRVFTGEVSVRSLASEIAAEDARAGQKQLNDMWKDRLEILAKGYSVTKADMSALRTREYTEGPSLMWRGNLLLDHGDYDAALADFDAAVKLDGKNATLLADRGLAYYWKQDYGNAQADFDAALAIDAENAVALRGLGALQYSRNDFKAAVDSLKRSLRKDPDSTFAWSFLAYCHSALGEEDDALTVAAEAITRYPRFAEMYRLRALILVNQGKTDAGLAELRAMLAACPGDSRAQSMAAEEYARLKMYPEALESMDAVIGSERSAENFLAHARVRDPDDIAGKIADLDAALALDPNLVAAAMMRARTQSEAGNHSAAIDAYSARLEAATDSTERRRLRLLRGIEYRRLGDAAHARADLDAALADDPDGEAYNAYCWEMAMARLDLPAALDACDKAVAIAPNNTAFLDSRGFVLLQLGRYDESIAAYNAVLALVPRHPFSLYGRGFAMKRRCECDDGDADLAASARAYPTVARTFVLAGLTP